MSVCVYARGTSYRSLERRLRAELGPCANLRRSWVGYAAPAGPRAAALALRRVLLAFVLVAAELGARRDACSITVHEIIKYIATLYSRTTA